MKDVRSQRGGVPSADKRGGWSLQMRISARFVAETTDFSKFMVCPHGQDEGR